MPKVRLYRDVEGDAKIGDIVEVDTARANFLVVNGYATHVGEPGEGAQGVPHLPPVGGERPKGTRAGVEVDEGLRETLLTPPGQREEAVEVQTAEEEAADKPNPSDPPTGGEPGPQVDRGTGKVARKTPAKRSS